MQVFLVFLVFFVVMLTFFQWTHFYSPAGVHRRGARLVGRGLRHGEGIGQLRLLLNEISPSGRAGGQASSQARATARNALHTSSWR